MIGMLTGTIVHREPDSVIVDTSGVGYRVLIPFSTFFHLPPDGERCTLHIHTHVTESAITLYGFRTIEEKRLFSLLITVSGVGPKMARDILSNVPPGELVRALTSADTRRLSSIPGIGKKTAERLILELKEKVIRHAADQGGDHPVAPSSSISSSMKDDVVSALVNLGYREQQVRKVVETLEDAGGSMEGLLKAALKRLAP